MTVNQTQIDACLPQTQCTQCNYPSCYDYAAAILSGEANINQCPPGGENTIAALAKLLGCTPLKLNPQNGVIEVKKLAFIRESACIGCTLCIDACPVDAIIGATKLMHTIVAVECTGCKLCLPVCPIDCIDLIPIPNKLSFYDSMWPQFNQQQVDRSRQKNWRKVKRKQLLSQQEKQNKLPRQQSLLQQEIINAVNRTRNKKQ